MSHIRLFETMRLVGSVFLMVLVPGGCGPTNSPRLPESIAASATATDEVQSKRDNAESDPRIYIETFDNGPGGWYGDRRFALPVWDSVAYCYSPWWTDANHAPPGAGYLHLVLFPLNVVPAGVEIKDIHTPRAVQDYPVDQQYLPKGLIMFDMIKIEYSN